MPPPAPDDWPGRVGLPGESRQARNADAGGNPKEAAVRGTPIRTWATARVTISASVVSRQALASAPCLEPLLHRHVRGINQLEETQQRE